MANSAFRQVDNMLQLQFLDWVHNARNGLAAPPTAPHVVMHCMNRGLIDVVVDGNAVFFNLSSAGRQALIELQIVTQPRVTG